MNAHKLIAIALAALLVFAGGAAATPASPPDAPGSDVTADHAPDDPGEENETDADDHVNGTETDDEARNEHASEGPPTDLPSPVPDHVSTIHQLIRDKLTGDLGNTTLGEAISGVVGADDEAEEGGSADATEARSNGPSDAERAGPPGSLPGQAADHVRAVHDAITSFLNGDIPGDAVGAAASG